MEIQANRAKGCSWGGETPVLDLTFFWYLPDPPRHPLPRTRGTWHRTLTEPLTTGGTRFLTFMLLSRRFLCLQRLSRLRSLEKPSSPLKAPLGRQSLQSSLTVYLLSTPKEELNHSHLCFPLVVLYKPTRALRLSWGTACRHFTSYISKRPISVFFGFPAITMVPGTRALTKCLLN